MLVEWLIDAARNPLVLVLAIGGALAWLRA